MASSFPIPVRALVFSAAATLITGFANGPALAAAGGPFLSHQALYELKLVKSRGSNAISGARGRILYNFSGSACDGYALNFRQVSELDSGEGKTALSDLRASTWEEGGAKRRDRSPVGDRGRVSLQPAPTAIAGKRVASRRIRGRCVIAQKG